MNPTLTQYCIVLMFANLCINVFANPFAGNTWLMVEDELRRELSPYRRDQRLQSDKSAIESLVRSRQNQLRAADRIRFRRNGMDAMDLGRVDLDSVLKLREKLMKASDGIRFKKRDISSQKDIN